MELRTALLDMYEYKPGVIRVAVFDKNLMRRLNKVLGCYPEDTIFQIGDEALFTFKKDQLEQVKLALKIKS